MDRYNDFRAPVVLALLGILVVGFSAATAWAQEKSQEPQGGLLVCDNELSVTREAQSVDRKLRFEVEAQRDKAVAALQVCERRDPSQGPPVSPPPPVTQAPPPTPLTLPDDGVVKKLRADLQDAQDQVEKVTRQRDALADELAVLKPKIEQAKKQRMEALRQAAACSALDIKEMDDGRVRVTGTVGRVVDREALRILFDQKGVSSTGLEDVRELGIDGCLTLLRDGWILVRLKDGDQLPKDVTSSLAEADIVTPIKGFLPKEEECSAVLSALVANPDLEAKTPYGDIDIVALRGAAVGRCQGTRDKSGSVPRWAFQGSKMKGVSVVLIVRSP